MLNTERRQRLVALVEQHSSLTVAELSGMLGVSPATIRRDLAEVSMRGLVERGHGGAARRVTSAAEMPEPPLPNRSSLQADEKRRIGEAAANLVQDGETIIVSGGTTTIHMIPHLARKANLTVITNALNVGMALAPYPAITVIMVGGTLRHSELTLLGPLGEDALEDLRADKLFMGSSAIHLEYGISAENLAEGRSDQTLIASAREVIVVADHTKFGRLAMVRVAPIKRLRRIVTGVELPDTIVNELREQGVIVDRA
jgi:DeoR/GlpR family transcriptional regulator of sugar metabolism